MAPPPVEGGGRRVWPWIAGLLAVAAVVVVLQARHRQPDTATGQVPAAPTAPTAASGPQTGAAAVSVTPVWYDYDLVRTYPHDPGAFTQGLLYRDGFLYESTGLHGESTLRKVELETGRVVQQVRVPEAHFAEGLAWHGGRLFQLTWQSQLALVYDAATFARTGSFSYPGEGWGLTSDGTHLIMSDGTASLRWLDPATFREVRRVTVTDRGRPVSDINELEIVEGEIFANVWQTEQVIAIAPQTGAITRRINLRGLLGAADLRQRIDVMNGIAYDAAARRLFVTGKWWPKLFEIRIRPR